MERLGDWVSSASSVGQLALQAAQQGAFGRRVQRQVGRFMPGQEPIGPPAPATIPATQRMQMQQRPAAGLPGWVLPVAIGGGLLLVAVLIIGRRR